MRRRAVSRRKTAGRGWRGQNLVEFALVLPLLLFLLVMMLEVGRLIYVQIVVTNAAWEGARVGATLSDPARGDAEIVGAVQRAAYGLDPARLRVDIRPAQDEFPRNQPAPYPRGHPLTVDVTYEVRLFLLARDVPVSARATTVMEYQNP